ncbi:MAG: opioid growth factor receptor-related protein [Pseudanabaena sp.]
MNLLLSFYRGASANPEGRTIAEIWTWDYSRLENVHNYIQWLFPLPEPSKFSANAPLLDEQTIEAFLADKELRKQLYLSFKLLLNFYGLQCTTSPKIGVKISKAANFESRRQYWLRPMNHNHLRITRILRSLSLLGLKAYAKAFLICLQELYQENPKAIATNTMEFWEKAV